MGEIIIEIYYEKVEDYKVSQKIALSPKILN
jgi:hypothetical protein